MPAPAVLAESEWVPRRDAHRRRVDGSIGVYLDARSAGATHPVLDFLFTYYSLKPGHLKRWHPGFGATLTGAAATEYLGGAGYRDANVGVADTAVTVSDEFVRRRRSALEFVIALLDRTAVRPPQLGCFGLHEWAMVYRGGADALRHRVPLRLGHDGTDEVVRSMPLRCTHYDAFRFFTPDAVPLNVEPLTPDHRLLSEQPGCLHASMDLYKWCAKLGPLIPSELLMDCFELSVAARELDMRASPYDLSEYGYEPVKIETPGGRAEYVRAQMGVMHRAVELRTRVADHCRDVVAAVDAR